MAYLPVIAMLAVCVGVERSGVECSCGVDERGSWGAYRVLRGIVDEKGNKHKYQAQTGILYVIKHALHRIALYVILCSALAVTNHRRLRRHRLTYSDSISGMRQLVDHACTCDKARPRQGCC